MRKCKFFPKLADSTYEWDHERAWVEELSDAPKVLIRDGVLYSRFIPSWESPIETYFETTDEYLFEELLEYLKDSI